MTMIVLPRKTSHLVACLLTSAILMSAQPAGAQTPPARNANIWDGQAHQPTSGTVQNNERADGIAPSQDQRTSEDKSLEDRAHTLISKTHQGASVPVPRN
jgi:hypothetical protein